MATGRRPLVIATLIAGLALGTYALWDEPAAPPPGVSGPAEQVTRETPPVEPADADAGPAREPRVSPGGAGAAPEATARAQLEGARAPAADASVRATAPGRAHADLEPAPPADPVATPAPDAHAPLQQEPAPQQAPTGSPAAPDSAQPGLAEAAGPEAEDAPGSQVAAREPSDPAITPAPAAAGSEERRGRSAPDPVERALPAGVEAGEPPPKPAGLLDRLGIASIEDALRKLFGSEDSSDPADVADADGSAEVPASGEPAPPAGPAEQTASTEPEPDASESGPRTSLSAPTIRHALEAMTAGAREKLPELGSGAPNRSAPTFDIVRVTRDGNAVIAGRAGPGAEVEVRAGDKVIDRVIADRRGNWASSPLAPLDPGEHEITLAAYEEEGPVVASEQVVVVAVPHAQGQEREVVAGQSPPPQPAEVVQGARPREPLAVLLPREGMGEGRILQAPGRISNDGALALILVDYDEEGKVRLAGEAPPGAPLRVYVDNEPAGEAVADAGGRWSTVLSDRLGPGTYTLRVDQLDPEGRPVARLETPFTRVSQPPRAGDVQVDYVIVQPGNSLWRIARRLFGQGASYVHIFESNRGQIRDPDLIYPGQVFEVPAAAG